MFSGLTVKGFPAVAKHAMHDDDNFLRKGERRLIVCVCVERLSDKGILRVYVRSYVTIIGSLCSVMCV